MASVRSVAVSVLSTRKTTDFTPMPLRCTRSARLVTLEMMLKRRSGTTSAEITFA